MAKPSKGIEPHRFTANYLDTVDALEEQVSQTGLTSAQAQSILSDLQQQSRAMVSENPFQIANRSGNLEQIKNEMRDRIDLDSATDSLTTFWSVPHLSQAGFPQEIAFFNDEVRPLVETNFFDALLSTVALSTCFGALICGLTCCLP
jgi:hypothetical protein